MINMPPLYLLIAKLEEEVNYQRKIVNTFLNTHTKVSMEAISRSIDILKRLTQILKLVTLILDEFNTIEERNLREQVLLLSSESLSLSSLLLSILEEYSPFFLESIFVYEEPILERLEAISEFIENSLREREIDEESVEEIAQSVEDIMKTLEYYIKIGERAISTIT